jgi:hypothetical protein
MKKIEWWLRIVSALYIVEGGGIECATGYDSRARQAAPPDGFQGPLARAPRARWYRGRSRTSSKGARLAERSSIARMCRVRALRRGRRTRTESIRST